MSTLSCFQPPLFTTHTYWAVLTIATQKVSTVRKFAITLLQYVAVSIIIIIVAQIPTRGLTMHVKQLLCQSEPRALTTTSVTGFLHFRHLELYRFV